MESSRTQTSSAAVIAVHRPDTDGAGSRWRAFTIEIDEQSKGAVRRGETQLFEVPPGSHLVRARIDWCCSRVVRLTLEPGERADLLCRNPRLAALFSLYWITLGRRRYPVLQPNDAS
jgi:hypothetical protein